MRCGRCLMLTVVLCSILVYRYCQFMPPEAKEPVNQMITWAIFRIAGDIISLISLFGYSKIDLFRSFHEHIPLPSKDERVQANDELFDGVKVRVYRPKAAKDDVLPALVFFHGGGWKFNSVNSYDPFTRNISLQANIVVVSVEYRLMPEFVYPTQQEDCLKVTEYLLRNTDKYKVDPKRIGVAGDSAGGNLAAAVPLKMTNEPRSDLPKLKVQILIYPLLQAFDNNLPSMREFANDTSFCYLTKDIIVDTTRMYGFKYVGTHQDFCNNKHVTQETRMKFKDRINQGFLTPDIQVRGYPNENQEPNATLASLVYDNLVDPYAWPLMASDEMLRKLPSTYVVIMEFDPLRDEGLIYAERLRRLRIDMELRYWEGLEHGLFNLHHYGSHAMAMDSLVDFIKRKL